MTPPRGQCNQLLHHVDEKKKVIKRVCKKKAYAKNTLHQYSNELERDIWKLIDNKVLTANTDLKTQLLRDVFLRLNKRLDIEKTDLSEGERKIIKKNITIDHGCRYYQLSAGRDQYGCLNATFGAVGKC